jgi:hypothetical protein
MKKKPYLYLKADPQTLVEGLAQGMATDKVTVDGLAVRFMYRETPVHANDSGWRFLSGTETDAYMEKDGNQGQHLLNDIARCDPAIVPFLKEPVGVAFERPPGTEQFQPVGDWVADED